MIKSKEYEMIPGGITEVYDPELYGATIMKVEREGQFFYHTGGGISGAVPDSSQFGFEESGAYIFFLNPTIREPHRVRITFKI